MARISAIVRRHNRRPRGTRTYETFDEIAHLRQLLTREQEISLNDQAAKNDEDSPMLLSRVEQRAKAVAELWAAGLS